MGSIKVWAREIVILPFSRSASTFGCSEILR